MVYAFLPQICAAYLLVLSLQKRVTKRENQISCQNQIILLSPPHTQRHDFFGKLLPMNIMVSSRALRNLLFKIFVGSFQYTLALVNFSVVSKGILS